MLRDSDLLTQLPGGFQYMPEFLAEEEERELLRVIRALPFRAFDFHGYTAKRRIVEYGLQYDFGTRKTSGRQPFPGFLLRMRERAAKHSGLAANGLVEGIVTEYSAGAPIGWHRDAPQFGEVIGISLGSSCRMRFKPYKGEGRIVSQILEPRSIYVIRAAARWQYQHSIPAVKSLRYSITFRSLREKATRPAA